MEKDTSKFFKRAVEECEENEENLTYDEIVERDKLLDIVDEEDPESYNDEQEYDEDGDEYCCIGSGAWEDFEYCCNKFSTYSDKILNEYNNYNATKRNLITEDLLHLQRVLSDIQYHTTGYRD